MASGEAAGTLLLSTMRVWSVNVGMKGLLPVGGEVGLANWWVSGAIHHWPTFGQLAPSFRQSLHNAMVVRV